MVQKTNVFVFLTISFALFSSSAFPQQKGDYFLSIADSLFFDVDDYDSAKLNYRLAKTHYESTENWEKALESLNGLINTTIYKDEYKKVVEELEEEFLLLRKRIQTTYQSGKAYHLIAYAKDRSGQYSNALADYERAIEIYESLDTIDDGTTYTYRNAAQIALRMLDYSKVEEYLKKALKAGPDNYYYATVCGQLARNYYFQKNFDQQYKYIQIGLESDPRPLTEAILNTSLAEYLINQRNYKEAEKYILAALDYFKRIPRYWENTMSMYLMLAEVYEKENLKAEANKYIDVFEIEMQKGASRKSRGNASLFVNLAERYLDSGDFDKSLQYFQKALIQVFPDFNDSDIFKNPPLADIYKESWIMDAAAGKAKTLKKRYEVSGTIEDLETAADCYQLVIAEVNALNKSYGTEASKIYLGDYGYTYFEDAIEIQYLLFKETGNQKYLKTIFTLMESSKAVVLSEAIQKNKAIIEAEIPDHLLAKEKEIRISIAEKQVELIVFKQKKGSENPEGLTSLELELADLRNTYDKHLSQLKTDYPEFQNLSESLIPPEIPALQNFLQKEKAGFIEFFDGERDIYLLVIDRSDLKIYKTPKTEDIIRLVNDFLSFFENAGQISKSPKAYFEKAFQLYKLLFNDDLTEGLATQHLWIVSDGVFNNFPFEALVDEPDLHSISDYSHYLLNKYRISYASSATLLLSAKQQKEKGRYFLNIVPGFLNGERAMAPLHHGLKETESIRDALILQGRDATVSGFKEHAEAAALIHLSTHAFSESEAGIPKIEFIDTSILLPEIYALNLSNTDLVVLSACETQLGQLKKGEGVMSLARGFFYAGSSSLVASLWRVNEQSTAQLFSEFYEYLQEGVSKGTALRQAKLDYLRQTKSDIKRSPYYWAGFICLGDDSPVEWPSDPNPLKTGWIVIIGLLLIGLVYKFMQKRAIPS